MTFPQSFKFLCLFLAFGISIVAAQPESTNSNYHCNLFDNGYSEYSGVCPNNYEPVCAKYFGTCDDVTCSVLYKTYPSTCELCKRHDIISFTFGPCKEEDCGEDCEEEEEWEGCYEECENCEEEEEECEDCEEEEEEEECDECEEENEVFPDNDRRV